MIMSPEVNDALDEVSFLRAECLQLIHDALALCPADSSGNYPDPFRTVVTPFLYAVWERCFTTSFGIMAKLLRSHASTPEFMTSEQAALWLQAEPFFHSLADKLRNQSNSVGNSDTRRAIKGSTYRVLSEFMAHFSTWRTAPTSLVVDTSKLVMTFSNVNCEVLDVNAEAIGLVNVKEFTDFRRNVGRLDDLVGRRNDIGHGTLTNPPQSREFRDLVALTNDHLIKEFCNVVQMWILFK